MCPFVGDSYQGSKDVPIGQSELALSFEVPKTSHDHTEDLRVLALFYGYKSHCCRILVWSYVPDKSIFLLLSSLLTFLPHAHHASPAPLRSCPGSVGPYPRDPRPRQPSPASSRRKGSAFQIPIQRASLHARSQGQVRRSC